MIGLLCNVLNLTNFQIIPLYYTYQIYCCHVKYVKKDSDRSESPTVVPSRGKSSGNASPSKKSFLERRLSNPLLFGYDTPASSSSVLEYVGITPPKILIKYFMCYVRLGVMNTEESFWSGRENGEKSIVLYLNSADCASSTVTFTASAPLNKFDANFNINTQLHYVLKYWMMVVAYTSLLKPVVSFIGLGFFTNKYFESLVGVSFAISLFGNLFVKDYHSDNFMNDSYELVVHRLFTFYELLNWVFNYMRQRISQNINDKNYSNNNDKDNHSNDVLNSPSKIGNENTDKSTFYHYYAYLYDKSWEYVSSRLQTNAVTQQQQDESTTPQEKRTSLDLIKDYDMVDDFS